MFTFSNKCTYQESSVVTEVFNFVVITQLGLNENKSLFNLIIFISQVISIQEVSWVHLFEVS